MTPRRTPAELIELYTRLLETGQTLRDIMTQEEAIVTIRAATHARAKGHPIPTLPRGNRIDPAYRAAVAEAYRAAHATGQPLSAVCTERGLNPRAAEAVASRMRSEGVGLPDLPRRPSRPSPPPPPPRSVPTPAPAVAHGAHRAPARSAPGIMGRRGARPAPATGTGVR